MFILTYYLGVLVATSFPALKANQIDFVAILPGLVPGNDYDLVYIDIGFTTL